MNRRQRPILVVSVDAPLRHCFDYLAPEGCPQDACRPGVRVEVPFGRGRRLGVVMAVTSATEVGPARLKAAVSLVDTEPLLARPQLELLEWAARYYHHPLGEVVLGSLPPPLRRGGAARSAGETRYRLTPAGMSASLDTLKRAPRQRLLWQWLRAAPAAVSPAALDHGFEGWREPLRALIARGWAEEIEAPAAARTVEIEAAPELNPAQHTAVQAVCGHLERFRCFALSGVTGSGKTEVYLQVIDRVLRAHRQALVLVPEIGLTAQTVGRFAARFDVPIALFHSGLGEGERLQAWLQARAGEASIVIGTRSAVWAPLPDPGVIIVDEEHDLSYKQQDGFRYSARDVAVVRAQRAAIPIILGSATPSLETVSNLAAGRYRELHLPQRAGAARLPAIRIIDLRRRVLHGSLSGPLLEAIAQRLGGGEQVLIFLNRRGYAPVLLCHDCGAIVACRRCDARMTYHRSRDRLLCHHCGGERALQAHCEACDGGKLVMVGHGTERVVEGLKTHFPGARIARIDRDSTRRKGTLAAALGSAGSGEAGILVGTQMLSKGHHFPGVTLVGVIDADSPLHGVDFRAGERLAQLIMQVAGRAGRGEREGLVIIQTHYPEHPLLTTLVREGYARVCEVLLAERRAAELPPYTHLALLRAEATTAAAPKQFLDMARQRAQGLGKRGVQLYGPVPAPMERRAGRFRAQLLLQAADRGSLHTLLDVWVPMLEEARASRRVRWSLDVDPQEML